MENVSGGRGGTAYRWVVAAACVALMFFVWGLGNHPLGLYTVPVTDAYGIPRSLFSVVFSLINLFNALGNLLFGPAEKKWGLKHLMAAGAVLCVCSYGIFYVAGHLLLFYAAAALFGFSISFVTNSPVSVLVNNWFPKNQGLVIGLIFGASGLGGTFCDVLAGRLLNSYGFKVSFGVSALILVAVLAVAVALVRPRQTVGAVFGKDTVRPHAKASGVSFTRARRSASFWLVIATESLWGGAIIPIVANMPAYLSDLRFDTLFVSGVVMPSLYASSALAKIGLGFVSDRLGPQAMVIVLGTAGAAATLMLAFTGGGTAAVVCAVCMGVAFACLTVPVPLLTRTIFGSRDYGFLVGVFGAALTLAGAAGAPLSSLVFDMSGTYLPAFFVQALFFALSAVTGCLAICLRPAPDEG